MITLGSDPEFLVYSKSNGEVWLPYDVEGTKEEPFDLGDGYAVHRDGAAAEMTLPYADTVEEAVDNMRIARDLLKDYLDDHGLGILDWTCEFNFDHMEDFSSNPYDVAFYEFGCSPDYDAYEGGQDQRILKDAAEMFGNWRFAGGHIHVGHGVNLPEFVIVMFLDLMLWNSANQFNRASSQRQRWYGRDGSFRYKPYGFEYRTPTNLWCMTDDLARRTYENVYRVIDWLEGTSARRVQDVWNRIPWLRMRELDSMKGNWLRSQKNERMGIVQQAMEYGFLR